MGVNAGRAQPLPPWLYAGEMKIETMPLGQQCALGHRGLDSVSEGHSTAQEQNREMTTAEGVCCGLGRVLPVFVLPAPVRLGLSGTLCSCILSRVLPAPAFVCNARQLKKTPEVLPPSFTKKTQSENRT